jgi:hypothetical protein
MKLQKNTAKKEMKLYERRNERKTQRESTASTNKNV